MEENKAIIFVRCSTSTQDLEHQKIKCQEYCNNNSFTIVDTIEEFNVSAYSTSIEDRKIKDILQLAYEKKFNHLVCFESSRISRNHIDGLLVISQLSEYEITVHSISEGILTNNSEIDSLINSVRFFSNQMSSKYTSQRIRSAKDLLRTNKKWLGNHMPLGYSVNENKEIIVNEKERDIVIDMFQTYLKYGSKATLKHLQDTYNISKCRVIENLQNRTYIGYPYKDNDLYFEDLQIIDDELWKQVQQAIQDRRTKGYTTTDKSICLFESKLKHICGGKLYISHDIKNGKRYTYYRCNKCKGIRKTYTSHKLDNILDKEIENFFNKLDKNELKKRYKTNRNKELKKLLVQQEIKRDLLKTKQTILSNGKAKIQEGLLLNYSLDMLNTLSDSIKGIEEETNTLLDDLQELDNEILMQKEALDKEIKLSEELLNFKYLYKQATFEEKKQLIRHSIDKIVVTDYDNYDIRYKF